MLFQYDGNEKEKISLIIKMSFGKNISYISESKEKSNNNIFKINIEKNNYVGALKLKYNK